MIHDMDIFITICSANQLQILQGGMGLQHRQKIPKRSKIIDSTVSQCSVEQTKTRHGTMSCTPYWATNQLVLVYKFVCQIHVNMEKNEIAISAQLLPLYHTTTSLVHARMKFVTKPDKGFKNSGYGKVPTVERTIK